MEDSEKKAYKSQSASSKESATLNMDYSHTEAHQMAYDFSLYLLSKFKTCASKHLLYISILISNRYFKLNTFIT